ncbi:transcription repressor NadR [Sediminibacillus massiliensis]|uniref:transcription repressor NadR n=1 Tax=Sediminibacillus massiliensis TaxID=1926277 RepID=UPI0009887EF8|nr:transcription repressor NadR [Sediminibacillus massiliensis]
MNEEKKPSGKARREQILKWLKEIDEPLTGGQIAKKNGVSRQVIVQDISLLKAKGEPIIATSQGYLYIRDENSDSTLNRIIVCGHAPEQTREELYILVDHGVTVKDVRIEHPVYGDLTASIMVSSRIEVDQFLHKIEQTNAAYLSELTDGTHLHTIESDSIAKLDQACEALQKAGILLDS